MQHQYQIAKINNQLSGQQQETVTSQKLAEIYVQNYFSKERNQMLAANWEHPGFLDVFDHYQIYKHKRLLKRRQETIWRGIDGNYRVFQKAYYHPNLTVPEEKQLSQIFQKRSSEHDNQSFMLKVVSGLGIIPLTFYFSRFIRPLNLLPIYALYYGGYYYGEKILLTGFQRKLNIDSQAIAQNLGLFKKLDDKYDIK